MMFVYSFAGIKLFYVHNRRPCVIMLRKKHVPSEKEMSAWLH